MRSLFFLLTIFVVTMAQARDATIAWDDYSAQEPNAVGVHVYTQTFDYGASACVSSSTTRITDAPLPVTDTTYTITGLLDDQTYCVWVRGIDANGVESDFSNAAMIFSPKVPFTGPSGVRVAP